MNKKDEALKMAIDTLISCGLKIDPNQLISSKFYTNLHETIHFCKKALEQPSKNIRDSFNKMLEDKVAYYKNKQPAQEPVAKGFIRSLVAIDKNGIEIWKEEPFYTQPPSWQGLSDDEMMDIWCSDEVESTLDFGRAIEQALKEKNCSL